MIIKYQNKHGIKILAIHRLQFWYTVGRGLEIFYCNFMTGKPSIWLIGG
jgi:hypothetical protein